MTGYIIHGQKRVNMLLVLLGCNDDLEFLCYSNLLWLCHLIEPSISYMLYMHTYLGAWKPSEFVYFFKEIFFCSVLNVCTDVRIATVNVVQFF